MCDTLSFFFIDRLLINKLQPNANIAAKGPDARWVGIEHGTVKAIARNGNSESFAAIKTFSGYTPTHLRE